MKSLVTCLILAAVLMIGDVATARDTALTSRMMGLGSSSCGSWTASARDFVPDRLGTEGGILHIGRSQWVAGFLSGVGFRGKPKASCR
jgi:hypothetical protein